MIQAEHIYKSLGGQEILKDISLCFDAGKTNLIIGRSGSGKTVLLKTLIASVSILKPFKPDSGRVLFDKKDRASLSSREDKLLSQNIGMMFQGGALFDSMTIEENLLFPLEMFKDDALSARLNQVNMVLNRVNLSGVNKKYPSELSGGMQKRAALARAIVMNPRYLFCDEPNSGLDPQTAIVIDKLIQEITKEYGITTVINTHDMNSVMEIGEKIVFISAGEKLWEGDQKALLKSNDKALVDFVFGSKFKAIRTQHLS